MKHLLPKQQERKKQNRGMTLPQKAFMRHFASIEDAQLAPVDGIAQTIAAQNKTAHHSSAAISMQLENVPTLFELEKAVAQLKAHKALPGNLVPEMLLANLREAAQFLFPAMMQVMIKQQTCTAWKAGFLYPLYKRNGPPTTLASYRAILLQELVPKLFDHVL